MAVIKKYTKKDGSTAYQFDLYLGIDPMTGKKKRTTRRGFKTQKDAKLALATLELEVENGELANSEKMTYQQVYDLWMEQYKNMVKESTLRETISIFNNHILPVLGNLIITSIDVLHCQRIVNQWFKKRPKRFIRYRNYSSNVFHYAQSIKLITENPMTLVTIPIVKTEIVEETPHNFYDRSTLLDFLTRLKNSEPKAYTFFHLLAYTGIRKGEALALSWRDVNFDQMKLTINKTIAVGLHGRIMIQTPKTKNSIRTLSLDQETIDILKDWRRQQQEELKRINPINRSTISIDQMIFTNLYNEPLQVTAPSRWLRIFYRDNPELPKITTHGFRHTHCSLLFACGASIKEVQDRLGHADIQTTMNIYAHVTEEAKEETALKFSDYMKNNIKGIQKGIQTKQKGS